MNQRFRIARIKFIFLGILISLVAKSSLAGDPNARDWIPADPGTDATALYLYGIGSRDVYSNGNRIDGARYSSVGAVFRQIHYGQIAGITTQLEAIVPFSQQNLLSNDSALRNKGIGDVQLGFSFWPINHPESKTWFGMESFVSAPTGAYNPSQADAGPGANRWSFIQDFAFSKGIGERSYLELIGEVQVYGRNSNYFGSELTKAPNYRLNILWSTDVTSTAYWGIRYRYENGGAEKISGMSSARSANNHQLALEFSQWVSEKTQLQAQFIQDLHVVNGPRASGLQLRLLHVY